MIGAWETSPQIQSFPQAILHVDGDAFFASCEVALHPDLRGRPVITGKERGIVSSLSYEAKARGIIRGMTLYEVKKICPDAVILASDYETYSLFSKRMFSIMRRFTTQVEEYGIDEGFADITGMRGPLHMGYEEIARTMKKTIDTELGLTVSIGLAPTKSLAKMASKWQKPNGFTSVPGRAINGYLSVLPIDKLWGVGKNTAAHMYKLNINTALDFIKKPIEYITQNFTKPHQEMWHELRGTQIWPVVTEEKNTYASISKTKTFTPASDDARILLAQLTRNLENACIKARRHNLVAKRFTIYLRTQDFKSSALECKLTRATNFPHDLLPYLQKLAADLINKNIKYRATGIILSELTPESNIQTTLFELPTTIEKMQRIYAAVDQLSADFGKHVVHLGGSQLSFTRPQYAPGRTRETARSTAPFHGETARQHLRIPRLAIIV